MTAPASASGVVDPEDPSPDVGGGDQRDGSGGQIVTTADEAVALSPSRGLRRNLAALTSGQFITWTMTLVWTLIVPRALGPDGMGLIVSGWAVAGVLGIVLGLGTKNYLVREMVLTPEKAPALLGTAVALRIVMTPLFAVATVVYVHFADYGHEGTLVVYLAAGATLFILLAEPWQAAFQAIERMEYLAYSEVISKSAQGLVGVALALMGIGAAGITTCWLLSVAVALAADVVWLRSLVRIDVRTTWRRMVQMVRASLAYWAFGVFMMMYLWIDALMLSLMTRPEVVGWYGVPTKLFQTLMFLPVIVSTAWLPRLVAAFREGPEALRRESRAPLELVLLLGLPLCAATVVVAQPLVSVLYGPAYRNAVPVLMLLGLCIPFMYLNIIVSQILIAANRQIVWTWVIALATVLNPLLNAALITVTDKHYGNGAIGAAIALLVTEAVLVVIGFVVAGHRIVNRALIGRAGRVAAASGLMCLGGLATRPVGMLASLATAAVVFVTAAWLLRIATPAELAIIRNRVHWLRPRSATS